MEQKILIINPGSASKKYAFYVGDEEVLRAHFEAENDVFLVSWLEKGQTEKEILSDYDYKKSTEKFLKKVVYGEKIKEYGEITGVAIRTVASGTYFLEHHLIDEDFLDKISEAEDRAPLHLSSFLHEIRELQNILPEVKKYSISDSAFYSKKNKPSKYYGLPVQIAEEYDMYRFGYHGISASSVVRKLKKEMVVLPLDTIICHLGSGISVIGVKNGIGFDTSMGFTPLEGAVMSTRSGNIDAGALCYLLKRKGFSSDELISFLNKKCGLLGLSSGKTDDMRELIRGEDGGDEDAKRAIDVFVYRIKKEIGSMVFALGGVELVVFTATMGERSNIIREKVCTGMKDLGIVLNKEKNKKTTEMNGVISEDDSPVKVVVVKTDEMGEMFEIFKEIIQTS